MVRHCILLSKLSKLDIPPVIHNWIIAFLTGRSPVCKTSGGRVSVLLPITGSIIQGLGLGPTLWLVMARDLHPLSDVNIIVKYADDVNLLIPEKTDMQLHDEFAYIQQWADKNGMVLNLHKTKEILFHRPHPSKFCLPLPLEGIERVQTAKLRGLVFQGCFSFVTHVDGTLKLCNQQIFLLKQLRDQGIPLQQLHVIFQAIILNHITYAIPTWGRFVSADLWQKIKAFLKRSWRYRFIIIIIIIIKMQDL